MTETQYADAVRRNSQRLFLLALSFTRSRQDAEDVMQSAFLKLWQHRGRLEGDEAVDKWLTKVSVNECRSLWRRHAGRTVSLEELGELAAAPPEAADRALVGAVLRLPDAYRAVIHLFYYEALSVKQIAGLLHLSEAAVRQRLTRGRKQLRQELEDHNEQR